jgi:hypothetical protein
MEEIVQRLEEINDNVFYLGEALNEDISEKN